MNTHHFELIGVGGTFDLLHKGHKDFLRFALSKGKRVLLGITTDAFARSRKDHVFESYEKRKEMVTLFLVEEGTKERVEIAPLESVYIPEVWANRPIEALFVTEDSQKGAVLINEKRQEIGETPLKIASFPLSLAYDNSPISSSRIRAGEIDREGNSFVEADWLTYAYFLPKELRKKLQKPLGDIIDAGTYEFSASEKKELLAVGDVTTTLLHRRGIVPKLSVVDLQVERQKKYASLAEMPLKNVNLTYSVQNTPGQLSPETFQRVRDAFSAIRQGKTVLLHVIGEEDLVVIPVILYAPLGFVLCYGQPHEGTVMTFVSGELKQKVKELMAQFTREKEV